MSGEKRGVRDTIDKMAQNLRASGVPQREAERITKDAARRYDRRVEEGREKLPK